MEDLLGPSFQEVNGGSVHLAHGLQEWSSHCLSSQGPGSQPYEGGTPTKERPKLHSIRRIGLWPHIELVSSPDLASNKLFVLGKAA